MTRSGRARGFTIIEILVALAVATIGLLGVLGLQTATTKGNRLARDLERARVHAGQVMEDLRARPIALLPASGSLPDVTSTDGTTYTRAFTMTGVTGSTTLVRLTATVTFVDPADGSPHQTSVELVRTTEERL